MDLILLGNRIKQARIDRELTIDQLSSAINVSKSTISRYERGEFEKPKLPIIQAIANTLAVNPDWLCGKSEDKTYTPINSDFRIYTSDELFMPLERIRNEHGLSAEDVAYKIGISVKDYLQIENGANIDCLTLCRLAHVLYCSTDYLLAFEGIVNDEDQLKLSKIQSDIISDRISSDEANLLLMYRSIDDRGKEAVKNTLHHEYFYKSETQTHFTSKEA